MMIMEIPHVQGLLSERTFILPLYKKKGNCNLTNWSGLQYFVFYLYLDSKLGPIDALFNLSELTVLIFM